MKRQVAQYLRSVLRRRRLQWWPSLETREYRKWIAGRVAVRRSLYRSDPPPQRFSILTAVWNGSPHRALQELARSIEKQNAAGVCQWVVLSNGCDRPELIRYLQALKAHRWVKLVESKTNVGITRGLRLCLEEATGIYALPVDADDLLYGDALKVVNGSVEERGFPPLLYTDEDKVMGSGRYQPYLKPDFDPVLLLNSAYTAHLGIVDRQLALQLGAYDDPKAEGSPDWDLFLRFLAAGYPAAHVPEVVYSWRIHGESTAADDANKPYIEASQRHALQRFLQSQPESELYRVERNPLFRGGTHLQITGGPRRTIQPWPGSDYLQDCRLWTEWIGKAAVENQLILFRAPGVECDSGDWKSEAETIFGLHHDAVQVGGALRNRAGMLVEAGLQFGFNGLCGSPLRGRQWAEPGYFGQTWKRRSVPATSTAFSVVSAAFLASMLRELPSEPTSVAMLGIWIGAHAAKTGRRIVYSPFLSGVIHNEIGWTAREEDLFRRTHQVLFAAD